MKLFIFYILFFFTPFSYAAENTYQPQEGDLIFQSLPKADLVDAIEGVSQSPYSHVGLVLQKQGAWFVREAISKVMDTPARMDNQRP